MKCRYYSKTNDLCKNCDIKSNIKCCFEFDFDIPAKPTDGFHNKIHAKECPTCGEVLNDNQLNCSNCGQKILWV